MESQIEILRFNACLRYVYRGCLLKYYVSNNQTYFDGPAHDEVAVVSKPYFDGPAHVEVAVVSKPYIL